jgi:hypothetical protein
VLDKDADVSKLSPSLKQWWDDGYVKVVNKSVPWLIASNGKDKFVGPLPATAEATLDLLKKYGGP